MSLALTRDEILALKAGPETDALIAEHVLGLKVIRTGFEGDPDSSVRLYYGGDTEPMPAYSAWISAAWLVVESQQWADDVSVYFVIDRDDEGYECRVRRSSVSGGVLPNVRAFAPTAPLAICRAALLVVLSAEADE